MEKDMNIFPYAASLLLAQQVQQATAYALPMDVTASQADTSGGNSISGPTFTIWTDLIDSDGAQYPIELEYSINPKNNEGFFKAVLSTGNIY